MTDSIASLGDVVELLGLVSRPKLNGTFAVVIEADSAEETEELAAAGRVKVTAHPKTLSIKPKNLRVLSNDEIALIDWSFMDGLFPGTDAKATVHAMIGHPTYFLGDLFKCNELGENLWTLIARGTPMPPKRHLNESESRAILNNTAAHYLYVLSLDRIGHQLVIETRAGAARLYQCYVESNADENGDHFGFTAREWLTGTPDDPADKLAPGVLVARERWGGADPMKRKTLAELLALISTLEKHAEILAAQMVSEIVATSQKEACKQAVSLTQDRIFSWTRELMDKPGCMIVTLGQDAGQETVISSTEACSNHPFHFTLPGGELGGSSVASFVQSYEELIGYKPQAHVFITMLHYVDCNRIPYVDPLPGHSAKGWGMCALTVSH